MMQLLALSGAQEQGSFTGLLQFGDHRLLIDAGMRLDPPAGKALRPDLSLLDEQPPHAVLLTHAHIDHTGSLPLIVEKFPEVAIYATKQTLAFLRVLFFEGVRSMDRDQLAMEKESFMFRPQWLRQILSRIKPINFGDVFHPFPDNTSIEASYYPAGHLLGAGMILLQTPEGRLLISGDCSLREQHTIEGVRLDDIPQADVMLCEGRYGESNFQSREEQESRLIEKIDAILRGGGRVLFPCFAAGRAQELILMCKKAQNSGQMMDVPLYLDGGVRAASQVFIEEKEALHPAFRKQLEESEENPFNSPENKVFQVHSAAERRRISRSNGTPSIIFSSSGMLEGGPSPVYAQSIATDRKSAIFFNAHQDDEFPGQTVYRCRQHDTITLAKKRVMLDCHVIHYNYSMHPDAQELRELVRAVQPQQLLLVQNETTTLVRLGRQFPKVDITVPQNGQLTSVSLERKERRVNDTGAEQEEPEVEEATAPAFDEAPPPDYIPSLKELYESVLMHGDERAWSVGEIAASFYKKSYQPQHRKQIKQLLDFCEPYFVRQRHGSDWMYTAQPKELVEQQHLMLEQVKTLLPGEVVVVQQLLADPGPPRIAIVQKPFDKGTLSLIAEAWKTPKQDWKVIKLIPGVRDESLGQGAALPAFRSALDEWRKAVKGQAVDLIGMWKSGGEQPRSFDELSSHHQTPAGRLALALVLLQHGSLLWEFSGNAWLPRPEDDLRVDQKILHTHDEIAASGQARVKHSDGRTGQLTGRFHWDTAEVLWDANTSFVRHERLEITEQAPPQAEEQTITLPATDPPSDTDEQSAEEAAPQSAEDATADKNKKAAAIDEPDDSDEPDDRDEGDEAYESDGAEEEDELPGVLTKATNLAPAALQKLLKDEGILRPRKDIRKMDRDELVKHFGSKRSGRIVFARLFRSLVWQAYNWIQKGKEPKINGGMQTFWYRWCLPALTKAPEYKKMKFEPYDLMCRTFTQMVFELRLFSYADFGFTDLNQRNRLIGTSQPNILVFAEKALWYPLLAEIYEKHGVSIIAFYGTPSSLTTEYTARELKRACGDNDILHLIGIVSYSPAGDIAARSFQHQLACVGYPDTTLRTVIHPNHYSPEELDLYRVSIPSRQKTKLTHWMEKTGGINNEPYGLESESMPQDRLKTLLEKQIQEIIEEA